MQKFLSRCKAAYEAALRAEEQSVKQRSTFPKSSEQLKLLGTQRISSILCTDPTPSNRSSPDRRLHLPKLKLQPTQLQLDLTY